MLRGGREDPVHGADRTRRRLAGIEYLGPPLRRRQIDEPLLMQQGQDLLTIGGRQGLPGRAPLAGAGGGPPAAGSRSPGAAPAPCTAGRRTT